MADTPITGPGGLPVATVFHANDVLCGVDVTDPTESASGTTKQYPRSVVFTNPTISGDATVNGGSVVVNGGVTVRGAATYGSWAADVAGIACAAGAIVDIGDVNSTGPVLITVRTSTGAAPHGDSALAALLGNLGGVASPVQLRGAWGTAQDAAFTHNVFWDNVSRYRIQNLSGVNVLYGVSRFGFFPTQ